jgi:hypothetical protein
MGIAVGFSQLDLDVGPRGEAGRLQTPLGLGGRCSELDLEAPRVSTLRVVLVNRNDRKP